MIHISVLAFKTSPACASSAQQRAIVGAGHGAVQCRPATDEPWMAMLHEGVKAQWSMPW